MTDEQSTPLVERIAALLASGGHMTPEEIADELAARQHDVDACLSDQFMVRFRAIHAWDLKEREDDAPSRSSLRDEILAAKKHTELFHLVLCAVIAKYGGTVELSPAEMLAGHDLMPLTIQDNNGSTIIRVPEVANAP